MSRKKGLRRRDASMPRCLDAVPPWLGFRMSHSAGNLPLVPLPAGNLPFVRMPAGNLPCEAYTDIGQNNNIRHRHALGKLFQIKV